MSKNTRFKRVLAQLLVIVLALSILPVTGMAAEGQAPVFGEISYPVNTEEADLPTFFPEIAETVSPSALAPVPFASGVTGYPDWATFLSGRDSKVFGTETAPGGPNIATAALSNITPGATAALRQSSQGNAASNASFAFNQVRSVPAGANANAHWNTQGANGQNRAATGTVGIAVDLLEGAPATAPWPLVDTVVIYATLHNNTPFHPPASPTVRGIGRVSVESGSHAAFTAQPSSTTHANLPAPGWGDIASDSSGITTLENNSAVAWRTFGNVAEIQPGNQNRVFVFTLDEPAPVRYLKALIEILVPDTVPPDGAGGGLAAQVSISSFEAYNSQVTQRGPSGYPTMAAFLAANDPTDTGVYGTIHAAGAGNLAGGLVSAFGAANPAVIRASSFSNAAGNPTNAIDGIRQESFAGAAGGGIPPAPEGRAGSWATQGATDHSADAIVPSNAGLGILFDTPQTFDTVIVFAGHSGTTPFLNANVPTITVETGSAATFDTLNPAQTLTGGTFVRWPAAGAPGWTLFSESLETNGVNRVFVFRTATPVTAESVRVTMYRTAGTAQIFINAFEVYNSQGQAQPTVVPPPIAAPAPGHFTTAQSVTLTSTVAGAVIHYTTDGSTPTTSSAVFTAPINVASTMTIRAIAVYDNMESEVAVFSYTISEFAPSPFAEHYLTQRGAGFAVIDARYDGMSNVIGHPALIDANRATGRFPVFRAINGIPGTVIVGTLHGPGDAVIHVTPPVTVDASGNAIITIPDSVPIVEMVTYRMAFTLTYDGRTLRDARFFTPISNFERYRSVPNLINSNNANVANIPVDSAANSFPALLLDGNNRLQYFPDYRGNRIMDYSSSGFQGGAEIPNIPIVREIGPFNDPYRDAWRMIQDAIDYVSARPIDPETGFRGVVYLREGVYRISQPLLIAASGVVIRGAGDGAPTPGIGLVGSGMTSIMTNTTGIPGTLANPMQQQIACQEFEPGVTKIIATWQINPDYVQTNLGPGGTTGVFGVESTSIDRSSSARWDTLVHFIGPSILGTPVNFQTYVMDQYVGAGQYVIHLENTAGLNVGDLIFVHKTINPDWARAMYMHDIDGANGGWVIGGNLAPGFNPVPSPIYVERYITAINHTTGAVTLDVALADNLDIRWGASIVRRFVSDDRIRNVGIENIQGITDFNTNLTVRSNRWGIVFDAFVCENHPMQFISMTNVVDGFARNWVSYHFDRGFTTNTLSRNITVQDAMVLEPVSLPHAGARRYSLYIRHGSRVLIQRTYAHYARHAFSWSSYVSGPNVFLHSESPFVTNASEPHFRWSSGGLFDNVAATFYLQNRWSFGTSHGHAGVNYVLFNTFGRFMASQPQVSPNYVIGHWWEHTPENMALFGNHGTVTAAHQANGNVRADTPVTGRVIFEHTTSAIMNAQGLNGGWVPNFPAYEFLVIEGGNTRPVNPTQDRMPESLFIHQVLDARGPGAVALIKGNQIPAYANWVWANDATIDPPDETEALRLTSLRVNGVEIEGFSQTVFMYTHNLPFGFASFPVITAYSAQNVEIIISTPTIMNPVVTIRLIDIDHPHNMEEYTIVFDSPGRSPILTSNWQQAPPFTSDANFTLNLLLGNETHPDANTPRWASNINPSWLRLYLGYTPKMVEGVNIGFVPGAPIRTYFVRFEYSLDGLAWTPIDNGTTFSNETPVPVPWTFTSRPSAQFVNSLPVQGQIAFPDNGLQHFIFDTPVEARFIRIWGDGRLDGAAYAAWNNYWHLSPRFISGTGFVASQSIVITGDNTVAEGTQLNLTATIAPTNATFDDVVWASSDPTIAHVDALRGIVTAIRPGNVVITATSLDGVITPNTGIMTPYYVTTFALTVTAAVTITRLAPPSANLTGSVLSWNAVASATGYAIYVNGVRTNSLGNVTSFNLAGLGVGTHLVQVKAIGDSVAFTDSVLSNAVTFTVQAPGAVEPTPTPSPNHPEPHEPSVPSAPSAPTTPTPVPTPSPTPAPADDGRIAIEDSEGVFVYLSLADVYLPEGFVDEILQRDSLNESLLTEIVELGSSDIPATIRLYVRGLNLSDEQLVMLVGFAFDMETGLYEIIRGHFSTNRNYFFVNIDYAGIIGFMLYERPVPLLTLIIGQVRYYHNNVPLTNDVSPFISGNRTMVPLRLIAEALGATPEWNSATRTAYIYKGDVVLRLPMGYPLPGGLGVPEMRYNRVFVPVRFVIENFDAVTLWDAELQKVTVYTW